MCDHVERKGDCWGCIQAQLKPKEAAEAQKKNLWPTPEQKALKAPF